MTYNRKCVETACTLLRWAVWHDSAKADIEHLDTLTDDEWYKVYNLTMREDVAAIIFDAITELRIAIPRPVKMRFISEVDSAEQNYKEKLHAAAKLAGILRKHDIRLMTLKGLGLCSFYPKPDHRPFCDVDIYLFGKQHEADQILQREYNIKIDEEHHHHTVFHIGKTMFENHYDFVEQHSRRSMARLEKHLKHFAETEEPIEISLDGQQAYIPSPNLNALFMSVHAAAHFSAGGISIRHLMDWTLFVTKFGEQVDWEKIYNLADEFGFRPFLECMNTMCVRHLGLSASLCRSLSEDEALVERAWNDVLQCGLHPIPKNFFRGWIFRIQRRIAGTWKQKMVYKDNLVVSFLLSAATHVIKPKYWQERKPDLQ